ncbi:MAG: hypothetical protein QXO40_03810 [Candidatus Aenigmatarchaeota archaeon]
MTLKENIEDGKTILQIENKFFRLEIIPEKGGRIKSFYDKRKNFENLYWTEAIGGMLDDRGESTLSKYNYEAIEKTSEIIKIKLYYTSSQNIYYEKILTFYENKPLFKVDYKILKLEGEPVEFSFMMRNFIKCAGKDLSEEIIYYYPTENGVQKVSGNKLEKNHYVKNLSGGWCGIIDNISKGGIAVLTEEEKINYFYFWTGSKNYPTFEISYKSFKISSKDAFSTTIYFILTDDIPGYSEISQFCVIYTDIEEKDKSFTFTTYLQGIWDDFDLDKTPILNSSIISLDDKRIFEFENNFFRLRVGEKPYKIIQKWTTNIDNELFILKHSLYSKNLKLIETEIPFYSGTPKFEYKRKKAIEKKEKKYILKLTEDDIKRGYIICFPEEQMNFNIDKISLDVGIDDKESVEINIFALRDVELKIQIMDFINEKGDVIKNKILFVRREEDRKLLPVEEMKILSGEKKSLFFTFDLKDLPVGKYSGIVKFLDEKEKFLLPVEINIHNVKIEKEKLSYWMHYDVYSIFLLNNCAEDKEKILKIWPYYVKDLVEHKVEVLCFQDYPKMSLIPFVKVKEFINGYLPILDFSESEEFLNIALRGGLKKIVLRYSWYSKNWLPKDLNEKKELEKWRECVKFLGKQVTEYLKNKGFEVFVYLVDEPRVDSADALIEKIILAKESCPEVKIAGSISAMTPEFIKKLIPYIDIWEFQRVSAMELFLKWKKEKKIELKKEDIYGYYTGAIINHSYETGRLKGWDTWYLGLKFYSDYAYVRPSSNEYRVFSPAEIPISSPVWEGIRDGNRDFEYLNLMNDLIEKLKKIKKCEKELKEIEKRISGLMGEKGYIKWVPESRSGFFYHRAESSSENIRNAKKEILEIIEEIQNLLRGEK